MKAGKGWVAAGMAAGLLWGKVELAGATEFEPMGKALQALLGTTKVAKKGGAYLVRNGAKVAKVAYVEKGVYEPNCTHTWAIGLDPATGKVTQIRVIEMSCHHAFPTRAASFMDQFKGKGPADADKLVDGIDTVAKATGSSKLAAEAVVRAIKAYQKDKATL